jgi:hypothetical protein
MQSQAAWDPVLDVLPNSCMTLDTLDKLLNLSVPPFLDL